MQQLWRPLPAVHPFALVDEWAGGLRKLRARFNGGVGPLPVRLVAMAETLFAELIPSSAPPVLIHADLHHFNILAAARAPWLALDPHGVAAKTAYEVGALLRNPFSVLPPPAELRLLPSPPGGDPGRAPGVRSPAGCRVGFCPGDPFRVAGHRGQRQRVGTCVGLRGGAGAVAFNELTRYAQD